jgi:hypothetical protein
MLIRLRQATYYGNWAPLILFFDHIVESVLRPGTARRWHTPPRPGLAAPTTEFS